MIHELENFRIPEIVREKAYNDISAPFRAAIKTALALAWFHFGTRADEISQTRTNPCAGITGHMIIEPVDRTWLFIPADYRANALACAAAVLPVIAKSEEIECILVGTEPRSGLLATLELTGIENIYCLPLKGLLSNLKDFEEVGGVLFLLHYGELDPLKQLCIRSTMRIVEYARKPTYRIEEENVFNREKIKFALGTDPVVAGEFVDCIFGTTWNEKSPCRMYLEPGCEAFWIFDGIGPEYFFKSRYGFELVNSSK